MTKKNFDLEQILEAFGLNLNDYNYKPFGSGHINSTFLLESLRTDQKFVLQKINTHVFPKPWVIAQNIGNTSEFLSRNHPDYLFIHQIRTKDAQDLAVVEQEYWRLSPFISNSYSINTVSDPKMAFEAAKAFGLLTKNLHSMPLDGLQPSIQGFHDLAWRYQQFEDALKNGNQERIKSIPKEIDFVINQKHLVDTYQEIISNIDYPTRMIHHDTKINNVLFDQTTNKSLCVCDLDTLMPGKIISDLGDMVRTYTCEESEESTNFENIKVRPEYFEALMDGYLSQMKALITAAEKENLFFAGPFMIYMQGLRFLTDYLNNDIYYPIKHPEDNLNRAKNQRILLDDLLSKEALYVELINKIV
ncbi:phosphotransferase enzyme family protein [Lacihabitans sp. CCS-44]|uniref:phosphotransferase enzyme family protein n=1 Tax=Lacihabitans sp. CCS-44 TaxID=2487331 RepID=UPI0020CE2D2E|nr:aminoglycoside phosphotransferase family protein [Lacihabitans sp. CCS-44]